MKLIKLLVVIVAFAFVGKGEAQDLKFGHIHIQEMVNQLPDKIAADKELTTEGQKLQEQLQVMQQDLNNKFNEYIAQRDTLPDLIRATKEKEIQDYEQRINQFSQIAKTSITQKEQQLLQPIIVKVQKAIDEVGQEQGLVYIFDISSQVVVYHSEKSIDCAPLVKAKLGVQ